MYGKQVLLHGGGLDSTAVFLLMLQRPEPFSVLHLNYGQLAVGAERQAILNQLRHWSRKNQVSLLLSGIPKPPGYSKSMLHTGNHKHDPIVEGRNLSCILHAANLGFSDIYVGLDKPASKVAWPDASKTFVRDVNKVLRHSYLKTLAQVHAPFIDVDKTKVFEWAKSIRPDFFDLSFTCWTPVQTSKGQVECGKCKHCLLKQEYMEEQ